MKVLMVLNKAYAQDPRAQRAVTALSDQGHRVDVICFADPQYKEPTLPGVRWQRIPIIRSRRNRLTYVLEYAFYFLYCFFACALQTAFGRHDVMQVFVMPEALSIVTLLPKLWGTRIVIDWMDLGYEVYLTKYGRRSGDLFPGLIHLFEKLTGKVADLAIFPNEGFHRAVVDRGIKLKQVAIVMNSADEAIFGQAQQRPSSSGAIRLLYNGFLDARNGWDVAVDAAEKLARRCPDVSLTMLGEGPEQGRLVQRLESPDARAHVHYAGRVPLDEMAACIRQADIGLITTRRTPMTERNVPTRIFEFGALRCPVVAADLGELHSYFDDTCVAYCEAGNPEAFADCIQELMQDEPRRARLAENLHERCRELSWSTFRQVYLEQMEALAK